MSSSDVSDAEENSICGVEGFQFEPLRKDFDEDSWETVEEYDDEGSEPDDLNRLNLSIDGWCPCKVCMHMPTEQECVCCHDLEAAHIFDLKGAKNFLILCYFFP